MKSLLQSLFGKSRSASTPAPADLASPESAKVVPLAPPPPPVEAPVELLGPELALITRGARLYGNCPHCEAQFSVRERMLRLRLTPDSRSLTCPACAKPVSLPEQMDRRKLS